MDYRVQLLIVDDSLTIRAMMAQVIARDDDINIIGVASSGDDAVDMIERYRPDVITIDIAMPGMDGLALVDHVLAQSEAVPLVVSNHGQQRDEALRRGALAFFDKARLLREPQRLIDLIKRAGRNRLPGRVKSTLS